MGSGFARDEEESGCGEMIEAEEEVARLAAEALQGEALEEDKEETQTLSCSEAAGRADELQASESMLTVSVAAAELDASGRWKQGACGAVGEGRGSCDESLVSGRSLGHEGDEEANDEAAARLAWKRARREAEASEEAEKAFMQDDSLDEGETLQEEEEEGRIIFSEDSHNTSADLSEPHGASVGAKDSGHFMPRTRKASEGEAEIAMGFTPAVVQQVAAELAAALTLQCAVRGWIARRRTRTVVLENFAQATPDRVFRLLKDAQEQLVHRQREHHADMPQQHVHHHDQRRQQRRRAAVQLQKHQSKVEQHNWDPMLPASLDMQEVSASGVGNASAPAAHVAVHGDDSDGAATYMKESDAVPIPSPAAAASHMAASSPASVASHMSVTSGSTLAATRTDATGSVSSCGCHSSVRESMGAQASRKRDLEMRLLRNPPQEVKSQLAPRCLFPTSPLVGSAAVNRRLCLSSKKTRPRKWEQFAAVGEADGTGVEMGSSAEAQTVDKSPHGEAEVIHTPAKVECAAQTDSARIGSHSEAPHTPAEKRLSMPPPCLAV